MYEHIIQQTLREIGITQFRFDEGIVDESTYLSKCQEVVGITNTNESILSTPTKNWATFKAKYDELEAKFPMDELRMVRNIKLTETDWTQNPDVPSSTRDKWLTYRQALRDFPSSANPKLNDEGYLDESSVTWPTPPS
tara:strand:+ start:2002 stop:2415 length:414 start_codon:yes stop_codon:yes gene_type:complete